MMSWLAAVEEVVAVAAAVAVAGHILVAAAVGRTLVAAEVGVIPDLLPLIVVLQR